MVERRYGRGGERGGEEGAAPYQGDILTREEFDGVIFDLDGVLTDTAVVHFRSWKDVFDGFLRASMGRGAELFTEEDYRRYVDGKPRLDGVRSFLESRGIELAEGEESSSGDWRRDPAKEETIQSLGRKKNENYHRRLEAGEISAFEPSVELVHQLIRKGIKTALVSSSRNAKQVLEVLNLEHLFDVRVDGETLKERGLRGKPAADMFVEAATGLGVAPSRAAVIEDAVSGVQAGRAGGFWLVIGVARDQTARDRLLEEGADMVVETLDPLITRH